MKGESADRCLKIVEYGIWVSYWLKFRIYESLQEWLGPVGGWANMQRCVCVSVLSGGRLFLLETTLNPKPYPPGSPVVPLRFKNRFSWEGLHDFTEYVRIHIYVHTHTHTHTHLDLDFGVCIHISGGRVSQYVVKKTEISCLLNLRCYLIFFLPPFVR